MEPNQKTQIDVFPAQNSLADTIATDHKARPKANKAATNDESHVQLKPKKKQGHVTNLDMTRTVVRSGHKHFSVRTPDIEWNSPWKHYRAEFELHDLGGSVTVAVRQRTLVHIRRLAVSESEDALSKLRRLRHQNIVQFIHAYMTKTYLYVVLECTTISLHQLAKCPIYPDEAQLGTIVGQVSSEEHNFWRLQQSKIDILESNVSNQVANQQLCRPFESHKQQRVKALSPVVQLLMQKYCKESPGVDDLDRWPPDSAGFTFLIAIEWASSFNELQNVGVPRPLMFALSRDESSYSHLQHPLARHHDTHCLVGLLSLARVSVFPREYSCKT
ncbi:fad-binding domain-containing protein [Colletotrichum incanum]|uniref:Fad-binding domain-containing protein n=1 Tax=Colletotrichum incanum TaxID=1573173 RepID=A0A161WFZ8_COLIC|nr:fad-binding domain-containing protein [Colletotrichum incanum]